MPKNRKGREIAEVIHDKCIGCQVCLGQCPVDAITMQNGVAVIDPEVCTGCGKCFDVCPVNSILFERVRKKKSPQPVLAGPVPLSAYRGVAVFIEVHQGRGAEVSWELVGKARDLAGKLDSQVLGFLFGYRPEAIARDAIAYGCDTVYMMDSEVLQTYLPGVYGKALTRMCQEVRPEIVLLGATAQGRDLSSVVATQLGTGLTADCTGLDIDPQEKLLLMTRPTFGGNIMATILCRNTRPQMSTVRPRVMRLPKKDTGRQGEVRTVPFAAPENDLPRVLEFIPQRTEAGHVDITRAPVLVTLGRGACNAASLPMLEELATMLGGTIACSRAVVESGFLPYARQVGQTGRTVSPRIYIGIAVSGAVQHLVGMQGSEKIIAINTDRNAPLVQIADYALIGDYAKIVPELISGFRARAGAREGRV